MDCLNVKLFYLTLSSATTQSEPGRNCNKGVIHILLSSRNGASPSGDTLGVVVFYAEMQFVYSTAPADWAISDIGSDMPRII